MALYGAGGITVPDSLEIGVCGGIRQFIL